MYMYVVERQRFRKYDKNFLKLNFRSFLCHYYKVIVSKISVVHYSIASLILDSVHLQ